MSFLARTVRVGGVWWVTGKGVGARLRAFNPMASAPLTGRLLPCPERRQNAVGNLPGLGLADRALVRDDRNDIFGAVPAQVEKRSVDAVYPSLEFRDLGSCSAIRCL